MKKFFWLLALPLMLLTACEENINDEDTEFDDWQARSEAFIHAKMQEGRTAISQAQAQWGDAWEAHCNYRIYRYYAQTDHTAGSEADSVLVEIIERGTGTETPYFTDSVQVNYLKRLAPSASYPEGRIIEHSGYTVNPADIFDNPNAAVVTKGVSNVASSALHTTAGEATAFQYMHVGDRWRLYIPWQLAYGKSSTTTVPAYSALIIEMRLRKIL